MIRRVINAGGNELMNELINHKWVFRSSWEIYTANMAEAEN